jgi:hypothetical protein
VADGNHGLGDTFQRPHFVSGQVRAKTVFLEGAFGRLLA